MANAVAARRKVGQQKLLPHYIGVTPGSRSSRTITHYVVIDEKVSKQLGIKGQVKKPAGSDRTDYGVVYKTNRRTKNGPSEAKRYLKRWKKSIKLYCKGIVTNSKGKKVQETYTVGFPSNVPLRLIKKFLAANCPNVLQYGTGQELYQVR